MLPATQSAPSLPERDPSGGIAAAVKKVMSSLDDLQTSCRAQGVDASAMLMAMLSRNPDTEAGGVPQAGPPLLGVPTDAELIRHSHDLIDALDRGDLMAVSTVLAPTFVRFADGAVFDRDAMLMTLMHRRSKVPRTAERTWADDHVVRKGDALVFTGKAREIQGGNSSKGGYLLEGWYVLQWVPTGDAWRVQLLTWQKESTDRDWFNDVFQKGRGFSREPNRLLVETVRDQTPGAALDLATGQGRNALYLAAKGWQVTGVDSAEEGLRIARAVATERMLALETVNANIDEWDFGTERFDLVTLMYAGDHAKWIEKIKASLRVGGLFVVEGWAKETPDCSIGFGAGQLAKLCDGCEIVRDEIVDDVPDWAWDRGKLVRFVARKR